MTSPLDNYSVWAHNVFNLRNNEDHRNLIREKLEPALPLWTEEFRGSRADCLRYLDMALIDLSPDGHGHRVWNFCICPPDALPLNAD